MHIVQTSTPFDIIQSLHDFLNVPHHRHLQIFIIDTGFIWYDKILKFVPKVKQKGYISGHLPGLKYNYQRNQTIHHFNRRSDCIIKFSFVCQINGLYRGATSSFIGVAFESSLLFGIYSQTKQALQVKTITCQILFLVRLVEHLLWKLGSFLIIFVVYD